MKQFCILYLFAFVIISSCKKEYPVVSTGTPVFYFNGTIDGNPINLQAGVNNYYMHSTYYQDSSNGYIFIGDLKQKNCVNCMDRIQFQIKDYKASIFNAPAVIDSSLLPGYYSIGVPGGAPTAHSISFTAQPFDSSASASSFLWNFGDGTTSTSANPVHVYLHPGIYNVCLTVSYTNSCLSSICNQVKVGVPGSGFNVSIQDSSISTNVQFSGMITGGTAPFTYSWNFGDGISSTLPNVTHTYASSGVYKVCLQVKDAAGYTANCCKNVSTQGDQGCLTNFNFLPDTASIANPYSFSNVTIIWTDNSGVTYSSNNASQPSDSYFQIISVENYLNNENNQLTKKLHVKTKCNVYNGSNFRQINNGDAVIAVAYK